MLFEQMIHAYDIKNHYFFVCICIVGLYIIEKL